MGKKLTALLATASASGTISAVRNLAANGIDVGVIASHPLAAAAWSRSASHVYSAPPKSANERFLERLLEIGQADPGQILLPTSDETVWLYTANSCVLSQHFCLYQPPPATIHCVLDKKLLAEAAGRSGLAGLPSWFPNGINDVKTLASTLPYPILIKPRTHVHRIRNDKGIVAHSPSEMIEKYQAFIDREVGRTGGPPNSPDADLPILQQFVRVGSEGVVSVTGFVDRTGEYFVTRHATKVFQRSQPVGVGVCFESVPARVELSEAVRKFCRDLGYFGIFEVEFVWFNGSWVVIDFNPRLYNQVGMDIERGMSLPLFACLDAAGETEALRSAVANAQVEDENAKAVYYDRFTLHAILLALTMTRRISRQDRLYWRGWANANSSNAVDAAIDARDPIPEIVHAMSELHLGLKALPRFFRTTPRQMRPVISRAPKKAQS